MSLLLETVMTVDSLPGVVHTQTLSQYSSCVLLL